ncbi:hypothetical protein ACLBOM_34595 [Escherichia coli]
MTCITSFSINKPKAASARDSFPAASELINQLMTAMIAGVK